MTERSELLSRAAVYRLLGRLWRRELDLTMLTELTEGPLRDAFVQAGGILPTSVDAATIDELAFDYCQVFLGPSSHLPPYQSVWTEGQFQGAAIASLTQYVELLPTNLWASESMLDHLGIELEVMAHLLEHTATTIDSPGALSLSREVIATFFRDHLCWTETLCKAAAERAQTEFYRAVMAMTSVFLADEHAAFGLLASAPSQSP